MLNKIAFEINVNCPTKLSHQETGLIRDYVDEAAGEAIKLIAEDRHEDAKLREAENKAAHAKVLQEEREKLTKDYQASLSDIDKQLSGLGFSITCDDDLDDDDDD